MNKMIVAAILLVAAQNSWAGNAFCPRDIKCDGLKFDWTPGTGFSVSADSSGSHSEIEESVCAVRQFCPESEIGDDGKLVVTKAVPPAQYNDDLLISVKLIQDCQEAIPSQISNACYEAKVWNSSGGELYKGR